MKESVIRKVGSVALTPSQLLIFDSDEIQQSFYFNDISSIKVLQRPSIKHPVIGIVLGLVLLIPSIYLIWTFNLAPSTIHGYLAARFTRDIFWGILLGLALGSYLLYQVATQKQVLWIQLEDVSLNTYDFPVTGISRIDRYNLDEFIKTAADMIRQNKKT